MRGFDDLRARAFFYDRQRLAKVTAEDDHLSEWDLLPQLLHNKAQFDSQGVKELNENLSYSLEEVE